MSKKQKILAVSFLIVTGIHLLFCNFYPQIYGWVNLRDFVSPFLVLTKLFRLILLAVLAALGFKNIAKNRKLLIYYLTLFFFNLVLFVIVS